MFAARIEELADARQAVASRRNRHGTTFSDLRPAAWATPIGSARSFLPAAPSHQPECRERTRVRQV